MKKYCTLVNDNKNVLSGGSQIWNISCLFVYQARSNSLLSCWFSWLSFELRRKHSLRTFTRNVCLTSIKVHFSSSRYPSCFCLLGTGNMWQTLAYLLVNGHEQEDWLRPWNDFRFLRSSSIQILWSLHLYVVMSIKLSLFGRDLLSAQSESLPRNSMLYLWLQSSLWRNKSLLSSYPFSMTLTSDDRDKMSQLNDTFEHSPEGSRKRAKLGAVMFYLNTEVIIDR